MSAVWLIASACSCFSCAKASKVSQNLKIVTSKIWLEIFAIKAIIHFVLAHDEYQLLSCEEASI
jgi:hypothetical protein